MSIIAMKLALEALERIESKIFDDPDGVYGLYPAINALRQAIEKESWGDSVITKPKFIKEQAMQTGYLLGLVDQKKEWVGLTDKDKRKIALNLCIHFNVSPENADSPWLYGCINNIESNLRENNT